MMEGKTETESIALSFVPTFSDDSKKATYLSYLIANFAHREACQLTPVSEKQVKRWKDADPNFGELCTSGLTELRKQFANQFIDMQFTRNFHMVLQKDFRVLYKDADPNFGELCTSGLTELRKQFANQFIDMQFTRNFHLVLQKDFRVLYKDAVGEKPLTDNEVSYLEKIRQHYTPQSLAMVKQLLGGGTTDKPFDFTRLTLEIKREQITISQEHDNTPVNRLLEV